MAAFGISRRKVEFYVQLGLADPALPKTGLVAATAIPISFVLV